MKCANDRCSEFNKGCNLNSFDCDYYKFPTVIKNKKNNLPKEKSKLLMGQPITEDGVQESVVEYCELCKIEVVHIPNEGKRSKSYGAKLKKLGMRKGFPDLFFPKALNGYHGFFIEMKVDRDSKPTPEQINWIEKLNKEGYYALVCYGVAEAIKEINRYFNIKSS